MADAVERNKQLRKRNSYFKDGIKYKVNLTYAEYAKLRLCYMRHHNKETKDSKRSVKEKHADEIKVLHEYYERGLKIKSFPDHIEAPRKCHEFLNSCGMNIRNSFIKKFEK